MFTSDDFYKDKALWSDPRYLRCNSTPAIEDMWTQRGAIGDNGPKSAGWGRCDSDYPREAIVSPYPFKTAQQHWEALKAETTKRGGPTKHTYATVPGDEWTGRYGRALDRELVPGAQDAGLDDDVAADAEVSDLPRAGDLSPGQHERRALAVAVLLARGLHAPLAPGRDSRPLHHGDAAAGPDHDRHRAQLRDQHPHRPRVRHVGRDAAARRRRAALVRRDDRLLGRTTR